MSNAKLESVDFVTPESVEHAYAMAGRAMEARRQGFADAGLRAAQVRDPKFMLVLGRAAEIVTKMDEEQRGFSRRFADKESERRETTETQMWREAFRCADEGYPQPELAWIYGAAAFLCGYYA